MRLAYADPPYPGQAARLYGGHPDYAGEVDHADLIARLMEYDGWALSTGAKMLPAVLRLCPTDVRVLAWVKTDAPPFNVTPQFTWEPVILRGGRKYQPGDPKTVRDSLVAPSSGAMGAGVHRDGPGHLIGRKPPRFCRWIFACLGAHTDDSLDDLFPGSGAVTRAWKQFVAQECLFDALAGGGDG